MRETPFGPFGWVVRAAAALALLALAGVLLAIMSQAAPIIRAVGGDPAPTAAPLPTVRAPMAPMVGASPTPPAVPPPPTPPAVPPPPTPPAVLPPPGAAPSTVGDAAAVRDAMMAAWQCDRARRGVPLLIRDPALDAAAEELLRTVQTGGHAAARAAAARYYEVIIGALPMTQVAAMRCDAPLPAGAPPTDAATIRIGLAVIVPPQSGDSSFVPASFALIGIREEGAP
jgi:hypothetical protein